MTIPQRSAQIWPVLKLCASKRLLLVYDELAELIGVPTPALGQLLEPIQSFCLLKGVPALSSLVVSKNSGVPGANFIAAENIPQAQADVYSFNWDDYNPAPEEFQTALSTLPSRNKTLAELEMILGQIRLTMQA